MGRNIISVFELNQYINSKFLQDDFLSNIYIKGEISNYVKHRSGHVYFTLKDDDSRISCVMFKGVATKMDFPIDNGTSVIIDGQVKVYEANGQYQIYVNSIKIDGIGDLFIQYEKLKQKLFEEGYFDIQNKKEIPKFPTKIAILSSYPSAAVMDVLKTIKQRFPVVRAVVYPIPVQGKGAFLEIIETLKKVDMLGFSTIILARGGGSVEDLWNFNEAQLVKAIYHCNTPIISGIGHEIDTTLCDFVCDQFEVTPTAAAIRSVPDQKALATTIIEQNKRLTNQMNFQLKTNKILLNNISNNRVLTDFNTIIDNKKITLDSLEEKIYSNIHMKLKDGISKYNHIHSKLDYSVKISMNEIKNTLDKNTTLLSNNFNNLIENKNRNCYQSISKLDALSPLKVLSRGYSLVSKNGIYISDSKQVNCHDLIDIKLSKGTISAIVNKGE